MRAASTRLGRLPNNKPLDASRRLLHTSSGVTPTCVFDALVKGHSRARFFGQLLGIPLEFVQRATKLRAPDFAAVRARCVGGNALAEALDVGLESCDCVLLDQRQLDKGNRLRGKGFSGFAHKVQFGVRAAAGRLRTSEVRLESTLLRRQRRDSFEANALDPGGFAGASAPASQVDVVDPVGPTPEKPA